MNSGENCFDCATESDCVYSAKKIYKKSSVENWPAKIVLQSEIQNVLGSNKEEDIENILLSKSREEKEKLLDECLQHSNSNYGRCVYKMDNDVCDNQIVNMQFSDHSTATLTMIAFSKDLCTRKTLIYGTKGQLEWDDARNSMEILHYDFMSKKLTSIDASDAKPSLRIETDCVENNEHIKLKGHGGSDFWLMHSFIEAILNNDKSLVLTDVEDSFKSHLIVFAAEFSRVNNKIVDIEKFCIENNIKFN